MAISKLAYTRSTQVPQLHRSRGQRLMTRKSKINVDIATKETDKKGPVDFNQFYHPSMLSEQHFIIIAIAATLFSIIVAFSAAFIWIYYERDPSTGNTDAHVQPRAYELNTLSLEAPIPDAAVTHV